tara:strand:- start:23494 stop:23967 length:474 start_codon:yes stop_codon:yes gene_type:complete
MTVRKKTVKRSKARDQKFVDALLEGLGPVKSAKKAGYSVASIYVWRRNDDEFAQRWAEADEIGTNVQLATLEAECDRRAVNGVVDKIIKIGDQTHRLKKYSDALLMFRMKKLDPTYREKVDLNHSGQVSNVMVVPGCTSVDDWEKHSQEQQSELLSE